MRGNRKPMTNDLMDLMKYIFAIMFGDFKVKTFKRTYL